MITSKANEKVKNIYNLNTKKYRDLNSKYILEGIKLVHEISSGENPPELIVYCLNLLGKANGGIEILNKLKNTNIELLEVSEDVFRYLSDTVSPQGILAVINIDKDNEKKLYQDIERGESYIILDKIQDAGNLGTILRTCVSFGVKNILCTIGTVDVYSPKVIRSTMGAINKVNIWYLDEKNLIKVIDKLKKNNYEIVGTALDAKKSFNEYVPNLKTVYIMGNEANGISNILRNICNINIKVEMEKCQESLNVAITTGILLYEMYNKVQQAKDVDIKQKE